MRIEDGSGCHLTYCSNIHPGETWEQVRENLRRYLPVVKDRLVPGREFGVGLRLSSVAGQALQAPHALAELQGFLRENGLYVFTVNGFPYGPFHGTRVKEDVYLPDWQDEERLHYTDRLADLLGELLPDGVDGSLSTVPGAFKPRVTTPEAVARMAELMVRHAAHLVKLRERTGRKVALALEPEPCCFLETVAETVAFFQGHLFSDAAVARLRDATGLDAAAARAALGEHLGVCLDLCHAAVEFEEPAECLEQLRGAGIRVSKLQISAGLRLPNIDRDSLAALRPFDDDVYLHQVVERSASGFTRYVDLPQAFEGAADGAGEREWRVHFHVPVFLDDLGAFSSTQPFIREMLALHRRQPIAPHLEVETYTWDVLPERFRGEPVEAAIVRELRWVQERLAT